MNPCRTVREAQLERLAMATGVVAMLLGCVVLLMVWINNVRREDRVEALRTEQARMSGEIGLLETRLTRLDAKVQRVAADVAAEVDKKQQLHLVMADVLARARALQDERDRFELLKEEVHGRLQRMDEAYMRAQAQVGTLQSR